MPCVGAVVGWEGGQQIPKPAKTSGNSVLEEQGLVGSSWGSLSLRPHIMRPGLRKAHRFSGPDDLSSGS